MFDSHSTHLDGQSNLFFHCAARFFAGLLCFALLFQPTLKCLGRLLFTDECSIVWRYLFCNILSL